MQLYHVELYGGHHESEHVMVVAESIEHAEQQAQQGKPHPYVAAECIDMVGSYEVHVVHKRKKNKGD
jgi:hypothetical protein